MLAKKKLCMVFKLAPKSTVLIMLLFHVFEVPLCACSPGQLCNVSSAIVSPRFSQSLKIMSIESANLPCS